jgi:hypothetical protein
MGPWSNGSPSVREELAILLSILKRCARCISPLRNVQPTADLCYTAKVLLHAEMLGRSVRLSNPDQHAVTPQRPRCQSRPFFCDTASLLGHES